MPDGINLLTPSSAPSVMGLYGQLMAEAALLYTQIGYQLSLGYGGMHRQRGTYFDLLWTPLGNLQVLGPCAP